MDFDIDVSGEDILSRDYTICVANRDGIIKGYKFSEEVIRIIRSRHGQELYRYKTSQKGTSQLKVRIYCSVIYFLVKDIKAKGKISFHICRDFNGKEQDIKDNLSYMLGGLLKLDYDINFTKLPKDSNAHKYSYLMRKDHKNKLNTYVRVDLIDIEKFLKK